MPPAIEATQLSKTFVAKQTAPGLLGSLRAAVRPTYRETVAVRSCSFAVQPGELVAFIGPNGAGKSTTIKMLSGILYPSGGEARVLGLVPWAQRRTLAYNVAAVFGQKSQLWYHLPPQATFDLLARIYDLPTDEYRRRAGAPSAAASRAMLVAIRTPMPAGIVLHPAAGTRERAERCRRL